MSLVSLVSLDFPFFFKLSHWVSLSDTWERGGDMARGLHAGGMYLLTGVLSSLSMLILEPGSEQKISSRG